MIPEPEEDALTRESYNALYRRLAHVISARAKQDDTLERLVRALLPFVMKQSLAVPVFVDLDVTRHNPSDAFRLRTTLADILAEDSEYGCHLAVLNCHSQGFETDQPLVNAIAGKHSDGPCSLVELMNLAPFHYPIQALLDQLRSLATSEGRIRAFSGKEYALEKRAIIILWSRPTNV